MTLCKSWGDASCKILYLIVENTHSLLFQQQISDDTANDRGGKDTDHRLDIVIRAVKGEGGHKHGHGEADRGKKA